MYETNAFLKARHCNEMLQRLFKSSHIHVAYFEVKVDYLFTVIININLV